MDFDFSSPIVMGILNITPDSFYDGGKYKNEVQIIAQTEKMLSEGASIIDIGAYSSRPGAENISSAQEFQRLFPTISFIKKHFSNAILSIDTFRSEIVEQLYSEFGDFIVNDISGGKLDENMMNVCGENSLPYICMHMQGNPQTMQNQPKYSNVVDEILNYFDEQISKVLHFGIKNIIIDPGFGFGKTIEQNFEILSNLEKFTMLPYPILVGISRKSMIQKTLHCTADEALNGTTVLHTLALQKGAKILRAHDVKPAIEAIQLMKNLKF